MDFLDPRKQRQHTILLYVGYALIGILILMSTIVLVYQANGFGVNSKGQVVQNGLVFFSSQPNPASIYLNGQLRSEQTNSRLSLAAGQYSARITREGYRNWQRPITVQGGDVQNFDYPFLFPAKLTTKSQTEYKTPPGVAMQSRDRRWLIAQEAANATVFDVYDLKNPTDLNKQVITLPAAVARGTTTGDQVWEAIQWADDNKHLLLKHTFGTSTDYIILDRDDVTKSVNLNVTLGANPAVLTLIDNKYDQYHLLSAIGGDLTRASLDSPQPEKVLSDVISYKSYGSKTVLYATSAGAPDGKVNINLYDGTTVFPVRTVSAGTTYLLDMAGYRGKPYVAVGVTSENALYIYRDPIGQLRDDTLKQPVALRAVKVSNPTYVAFSPNTQYIVGENGNQFGVYDIFLKQAYQYTIKEPVDAPQPHATWMDGNRLTYVSGGKQLVFDYDKRNRQLLMAANPSYDPYFAPDYKYAYTMAPAAVGLQLSQTPLLTAKDL